MPMDRPAGTVKIGANAWLFPSPSAQPVTDCFIIAHGGTPQAAPTYFQVPAGCTVNFFANLGMANLMGSGPIQGFKVIAGQNQGNAPAIDAGNRFAAGSTPRDYILGKALGRHYKAEPMANTYIGVNRALNELAGALVGLQWLPHYVSVRYRTSIFRDTNIWLSKLISQIRAHDATIVNFYCAHCRTPVYGDKEPAALKTVGSQALRPPRT
jgi:hypothetical protein